MSPDETKDKRTLPHDKRGAKCVDYVLVTPVRNEEAFIGQTIHSVVKQSILPREWIIVSDGSTDLTDSIVEACLPENPWIRLIKLPERKQPCFAAVVKNTTLGIDSLTTDKYDYLGLLDSYLAFQSDYFENLMIEFHKNPKLGLTGGVAIDIGTSKSVLPRNKRDVPGALQFFSRSCFESIGQLIPIPEGGWDSLTCTMARMNGYETKLATNLIVDHLKPRNTIHGSIFRRKWQMGERDYALGYHPIFEIIKCITRIFREKPIIIGSLLWLLGFLTSSILARKRIIPNKTIKYIRNEQINRIIGHKQQTNFQI